MSKFEDTIKKIVKIVTGFIAVSVGLYITYSWPACMTVIDEQNPWLDTCEGVRILVYVLLFAIIIALVYAAFRIRGVR